MQKNHCFSKFQIVSFIIYFDFLTERNKWGLKWQKTKDVIGNIFIFLSESDVIRTFIAYHDDTQVDTYYSARIISFRNYTGDVNTNISR
jgi:hypothetical protein